MANERLVPSPRYLAKLRVTLGIIAVVVLLGGAAFGALLGLDRDIGARGAWSPLW